MISHEGDDGKSDKIRREIEQFTKSRKPPEYVRHAYISCYYIVIAYGTCVREIMCAAKRSFSYLFIFQNAIRNNKENSEYTNPLLSSNILCTNGINFVDYNFLVKIQGIKESIMMYDSVSRP